jgi:beta-alanine degradation protein BauB
MISPLPTLCIILVLLATGPGGRIADARSCLKGGKQRMEYQTEKETTMKNLRLLGVSSALMTLLVLSLPIAKAQDIVKVAPEKCKVLLENDRLRVVQVVNEPGGKVGMHSHPPYVVYALTSSKEKLTLPNGKTDVHDLKAGQALWSDGVTHRGENIGTKEIRVLLIELKK